MKYAAAIVFVSLLVIPCRPVQAVTLIKDGKPLARIYVSPPPAVADPVAEDAGPKPPGKQKKSRGEKPAKKGRPAKTPESAAEHARAEAVRELNYHLEKMSGASLDIVVTDDVAAVKGPAVVLGDLAVKLGAEPKATDSHESFRLLVKGKLVLVGGENETGTLHGVYELLGRLGCDWVMPGEIGEIIPKQATVEIAPVDESQAPDFVIRRLWYSGGSRAITPDDNARMALWLQRQRINDAADAPPAPAGHVWDAFIRRHKAEFDKDPTMLALRRLPDGTTKRAGPQLESTHPRVIELFVEDIKAAFAKNNWPKDKAVGFGIGPADGLGFSESLESKMAGSGRVDPVTGGPDVTDLVVLLANEVLQRIEKEYPNVTLGYYCYSEHADYPARYKPHPRLSVTFADITYSRYHDFDDQNSKSRAYYRDIIEQWGKLSREQGNPLFFRGYNWNLAENIMPFTRLKTWGVDIPFYKKMGFLGCGVEASKAWSANGPHDFLFMKLLWNASLDWKDVLRDYCRKSFGDGGPAMERYYLRLVETQRAAGQEAGSYHAIHLIFTEPFILESEKDIAQALAAVKEEEQRVRIRFAVSAFEALKLYLSFHQATMDFDFSAAKTRFETLLAHWEKQYALNPDLAAKQAPQYLQRFLGKFVEEADKYSAEPYGIVLRLPDELRTCFDPTNTGDRLRYQNPAVNDYQFIKTKTYSTTWDAQGLAGYRGGAVWYRFRFALPKDAAGQPIGLFIGGVDDEARVWINGQPVGTSGQRFSAPVAFDLTDGIHYDAENLLAIQIVRNSSANELGTGGILRPSFLFTGPRLKDKAPKPLELHRVLPGGELGESEK